jgi:phage shock protein E
VKPAHHRLPLLSLVFCVSIAACLHVTVPDAPRETPAANYTDPDALLALLSQQVQPYVLVDVRTQDEYTDGHIPTAVNLPYDVIATNPPTTDTSALIIVYCASGRRSALAASPGGNGRSSIQTSRENAPAKACRAACYSQRKASVTI